MRHLARFHQRSSIIALASLVCLSAAHANDGYGELGLGGLVTLGKTYAVAMRTEVLEVAEDRIRVDYVFEKTSLFDAVPRASIPVLFPLPLYSADTPSHS